MLDDPRDNEILVRVVAVGVCHTDLMFRDAPHLQNPIVLGHEAAGIVEATGAAVTKVAPGDRVVLTFNSCGSCPNCRSCLPSYCEQAFALNLVGHRPDGSRALHANDTAVSSHFFSQSSFATHALACERNVVKVPDDLPLEILGPLGCGIQTGAGAIMRSLRCEPGSAVAIFGGGAVGLSAVMGAVVRGCDPIVVVEPIAARRALALELGAAHAIDPRVSEVAASIRAIVARGWPTAWTRQGATRCWCRPWPHSAPTASWGSLLLPSMPSRCPAIWPS